MKPLSLEDLLATEAELIFSGPAHGHAMEIVPNLLAAGRRVIDLSADYRLQDVQTFAAWYETLRIESAGAGGVWFTRVAGC